MGDVRQVDKETVDEIEAANPGNTKLWRRGEVRIDYATGKHAYWNGTAWIDFDSGSGGPTPTGTGFRHVTAGVEDAASKLVDTADINASQVTYAKIQNVSATDRFLGRKTAAAGPAEELTGTEATARLDAFTSALKGVAPASGGGTTNFLRADVTWAAPPAGSPPTGTGFRHVTAGVEDAASKLVDTADVNPNQVTNAKLAQMAANTVKANVGVLGDPEDLAVSANTVVGRVGADIVAAALVDAQIATNAISNASRAQMAANTVKANATAGTANEADLAVGTNVVVGRAAGNIVAAQVATAQIAANAADNTILADMAANTVKANPTAGAADPSDLAVGTNTVVGRVAGNIVAAALATAQIAANAVTDAALRQGAATTVIGRSANSLGNVADIAASANGQYLQRTAGALSFSTIVMVDVTDTTKRIGWSVSGNTTGVTLTLASVQTTAQTLTIPNITGADTLVTLGLAQTFTGANTHSGLNALLASSSGLTIRNPANTSSYTITAAAIAAARILNLPLTIATDTLMCLGIAQTVTGILTLTTPVIGAATGTSLTVTGVLRSSGATSGIGYNTGAGGAVVQATSKVTAFTLSTVCGTIQFAANSLAADTSSAGATWTNTAIAATDVVTFRHSSGGTLGAYSIALTPGAGTATIIIRNNTPGALAEAPIFRFAITKAVVA